VEGPTVEQLIQGLDPNDNAAWVDNPHCIKHLKQDRKNRTFSERTFMKHYPLAIYTDHPQVHFEHRTAARLARVAEAFIQKCELAALVKSRLMLHGRKGLCFVDVYKLKRIRHLHEDMGLDLEAVDFVLRYRNRIKMMQHRLNEIEKRLCQKEQEHQTEILAFRRRLAQKTDRD
jgi:hypothetical protein